MSLLDPAKAAEEARRLGLALPQPSENDGRFYTLNEKGAMHHSITDMGEQFLSIACQPDARVVDVGAAYGLLCLEALRRGASNITAVEMDRRHLLILARQVAEQMPEKLGSLRLVHGAFPSEEVVRVLAEEGPYDAINAVQVLGGEFQKPYFLKIIWTFCKDFLRTPKFTIQVLHFLTEPEVHTAFDTFHSLLRPGGKLTVVANTPYLGWFTDELIEKNRRKVEEWVASGKDTRPLPCFFPRVRDLIDEELKEKTSRIDPTLRLEDYAITHTHCFFFDKEVSVRQCSRHT